MYCIELRGSRDVISAVATECIGAFASSRLAMATRHVAHLLRSHEKHKKREIEQRNEQRRRAPGAKGSSSGIT